MGTRTATMRCCWLVVIALAIQTCDALPLETLHSGALGDGSSGAKVTQAAYDEAKSKVATQKEALAKAEKKEASAKEEVLKHEQAVSPAERKESGLKAIPNAAKLAKVATAKAIIAKEAKRGPREKLLKLKLKAEENVAAIAVRRREAQEEAAKADADLRAAEDQRTRVAVMKRHADERAASANVGLEAAKAAVDTKAMDAAEDAEEAQ